MAFGENYTVLEEKKREKERKIRKKTAKKTKNTCSFKQRYYHYSPVKLETCRFNSYFCSFSLAIPMQAYAKRIENFYHLVRALALLPESVRLALRLSYRALTQRWNKRLVTSTFRTMKKNTFILLTCVLKVSNATTLAFIPR